MPSIADRLVRYMQGLPPQLFVLAGANFEGWHAEVICQLLTHLEANYPFYVWPSVANQYFEQSDQRESTRAQTLV